MKLSRRRSAPSSSWMQVAMFNCLLILIPLVGAQIVAGGFAGYDDDARLTPQILSETRQVLDRSLEELAGSGSNRRSVWANKVRRELAALDMSAARGFLLAGPAMLAGEDVRAMKAAAAAEPSGSEDERLVRAALLFLPDDVRAEYETLLNPPSLQIALDGEGVPRSGSTSTEAGDEGTTLPGRDRQATAFTSSRAKPLDLAGTLSVLGSEEDLVINSQRWVAGDAVDGDGLRLSGLALVAEHLALKGIAVSDPAHIAEAASILKSALRSKRLQPGYAEEIQALLDAALPETYLREALTSALATLAPRSERVAPVKAAFMESVSGDAIHLLIQELEDISAIAQATSPTGALLLIEQAPNTRGVHRARRIAVAGSDRAVALVKEVGGEVLDLFEVNIRWSRLLILQLMGFVAGLIILTWITIAALNRAFARRVYLPAVI